MKKLMLTIVICLFACLFTACGTVEHTCQFDEWTVTKQPTCTEEGQRERFCSCGEKQTSTLAATGHSHTFVVSSPTCTEEGFTTHTCTCGDSYVDTYVNALGHTEGSVVVENKVDARCTTKGSYDEVIYCTICDAELSRETKIIDALGHDEIEHVAQAPTCTEFGWDAYETCSRCDYSTYNEIPATGHSYTSVVTQPSCTVQGFTTHTCACGDSYVDTYVDATGHTEGAVVVENEVDATCTTDGSYDNVVYCTVCEAELSRETITVDALDHDEIGHIAQAPTCTEIGWDAYATCSRCDYSTYNEIPATGHNFVNNESCSICSAEYYTEGLQFSLSNDEYTVTGITTNATDIVIPSVYKGLPVVKIASGAFNGNGNILTVKIPDSVTRIGTSAFAGCRNLKSITIPFVGGSRKTASDTYQYPFGYIFGTTVYGGSTATRQYYYGSSTSSTTSSTYFIPDSLKSVTVTSGYIPYGAFYYCENITNITLGNSVTGIGSNAFRSCYSLKSITIPDSVTSIGSCAFESCSSLTKIELSDNVSSIGSRMFSDCSSLTSITIPSTVTTIGEWAFSGCSSLTSITIPDSVTSIGQFAFYECTRLKNVYFTGEEDQWNNITIGEINENLTDANIVFNHPDHKYIPVVTPPTCTEQGYTIHTCHCGDKYVDTFVEATGHSHGAVVTPPTCTEQGFTTHTCSGCGDSYADTYVDALGHTEGSVVVENNVDATCTEDGSYDNVVYCTVCEVELSREAVVVDALGHDEIGHIAQAPTCTEIGWEAYVTCSRCDYSTYNEIPATGHDYISVVTHPTCTEQGFTTHTCHCGDCYVDTYVDATGHTKGAVVVENEVDAICTTDGSYDNVVYCTICDTELSRDTITVEALEHDEIEHSAQAPTCTEIGWDAYVTCSRCDYSTYNEIPAIGHTEIIDKAVAATCTKTGLTKGKHCSVCQEVLVAQEIVSALGHKYQYTAQDPNATPVLLDYDCSSCGDHYTKSITPRDYTVTRTYSRDELSKVMYNDGSSGRYVIRDIFQDNGIWYRVVAIGSQAFETLTVNEIVIPSTVKSIGSYAFYACKNLIMITIPSSVTSIGDRAFMSCENLSYIKYYGTRAEWDELIYAGTDVFYNSGWDELMCISELTAIDNHFRCSGYDSSQDVYFLVTHSGEAIISYSLSGSRIESGVGTFCSQFSIVDLTTYTTLFSKICDSSENGYAKITLEAGHEYRLHLYSASSSGYADVIISIPYPDHVFDNACDTDCNICGKTRTVEPHAFDNNCDNSCNKCGAVNPDFVGHIYDNDCDASCNECGETRVINHIYDDECDESCNICGTLRIAPHVYVYSLNDNYHTLVCLLCSNIKSKEYHIYDNQCDAICNVCSWERIVGDHVYTDKCDTTCNECGAIRTASEHVYDNNCDSYCNECGVARTAPHNVETTLTQGEDTHYYACVDCLARIDEEKHSYDNACDTSCNECSYVREIEHTYDNNCDESCNVCGNIRTVGEHVYDNNCDSHCNECGVARTAPHTDTNTDGICDDCGEFTPEYLSNFTFTLSNNGYTITAANRSISGNIILPDTYMGKPVTAIGYDAFYNCSSLTSIVIPDSVTTIGNYAFYNCSSLTSITIPDGVTTIGKSAFSGCSSLTYNTYDNAKYLGNETNPYLVLVTATSTSITSCEINENCKIIAPISFYYGYSLTSIVIPDGVTTIGEDAFAGCSSLKSIIIPASVTTIDKWAFLGCSRLTSITVHKGNTTYHSAGNCLIETTSKTLILGCENSVIPGDGSVTTIGEYAFSHYSGLTSITIPDSVTTIGEYAFYNCTGLTSITIPDSVTTIGKKAFYNCTKLSKITFIGTTTTWYRTTSEADWSNKTGGTLTYVSTSSTNATYFTSTYVDYYWYKL